MTNQTNTASTTNAVSPIGESKSASIAKLLTRRRGATMDEMIAATTWQAHSVRAFLSGLRKKGNLLAKEQRKSGQLAYRMSKSSATG